ncbi:MAG: hypothetical protein JXN63_07195 [Candidatus Delongbacteria bacterium]|nr:hypothetical protein [Candidatus Delongbacteria bacterium]
MKIYITSLMIMLISLAPLYSQPPLEDCPVPDDCMDRPHEFPPDNEGPEFMNKRMGRMPKERIDKAMEMLSDQFPQFHGRLEEIRTSHPPVFYRTMHKLRMFLRNEGKNPESKEKLIRVFNKEIDLDLLVEKHYKEKDEAKKSEIKSEMLRIMSETFDSKEELKLEIIKKIEKNLETKKNEYLKRQDNKEQIIKNDLERILKMREKAEKEAE